MTTLPLALLIIWASAAVFMTGLWLIQRRTGNAGIVDIGWAFSIGAAAIGLGSLMDGDPTRRLVVALLGGLWGVRLAWHIHRRSHGKPEDGRYRQLRREYGDQVQYRMFRFYQLQAITVPVFALPFALAANHTAPFGQWTDLAALLLGVIALCGESLADAQLHAFKRSGATADPVCRQGLWRYSRHPNYFFEWLNWCAFALLALSAPWGFLALFCPLAMYVLLVHVTGIPPTEEQAVRSKGEAYRRYQRSTSAFIPWFPKGE